MDVKSWTVCLVEPNKFEGQIILDLLRNAGADKVRVVSEAAEAQETLELYNANVVIVSFELGEADGAAWVRTFRRNHKLATRKAAIFVTSNAFSRAMAEQCRHAGANALIGKPISGKVLLATINKVLTNPRPFIDAEGYVGPCRRAGIVTAGAPKKRRKADDGPSAGSSETLEAKLQTLSGAVTRFALDLCDPAPCEAALRPVQAYAVNAGDGPLMRTCAALTLHLGGCRSVRPAAARAALDTCLQGLTQLAAMPLGEAKAREALAESVREAVAKAAMQRAA